VTTASAPESLTRFKIDALTPRIPEASQYPSIFNRAPGRYMEAWPVISTVDWERKQICPLWNDLSDIYFLLTMLGDAQMTLYIALTSLGIFVLDEKSQIVSKQVAYPDAERAATELFQIGNGETSDLIIATAKDIETISDDVFIVDTISLGKRLESLTKKTVTIDEFATPIRWYRDNEDSFLQAAGVETASEKLNAYRREVSLSLSRIVLSAASEQKDLLVKNAIDAVSEIDKSINVVAMRLREWYSLHHPSLDSLVEDHEHYAQIVDICKGRSGISEDALKTIGITEKTIQLILEELPKDIGAELQPRDITIISALAKRVIDLFELRKETESYIESLMKEVAPNISAMVGHMVGARLISLAGSLKDLARKPSSTVQVFGAEKALFRSIKTGAAPPKHGVIYQVPEIHSAPYWQRGKIARALAGKISIAARIDAYAGSDVGEKLRADFEKRVEEIKEQHPDEPPEKPKPPQPKRTDRRQKRDKRRKRR
jgi:nucleolar protein 56